jgi:hypothetical protein
MITTLDSPAKGRDAQSLRRCFTATMDDPRARLHQAMPMAQQLSQIPILRAGTQIRDVAVPWSHDGWAIPTYDTK